MNIVFCLPGRDYSGEFLVAWTRLVAACHQARHGIVLSQKYSSFVPFARAHCLGGDVRLGPDQVPFQGKVDYDVMMWIDSDVLFTPEMIFALIDSPHPVTAGLYMMEDNAHFPVVTDWDVAYFKTHARFPFMTLADVAKARECGRYLPVEYVGMGLMAIKRGVVEKIKFPWFHYPLEHIPTGNPDVPLLANMCSEDVAFCRNLRASGVPVMVDLEIRGGHQKRIAL